MFHLMGWLKYIVVLSAEATFFWEDLLLSVIIKLDLQLGLPEKWVDQQSMSLWVSAGVLREDWGVRHALNVGGTIP